MGWRYTRCERCWTEDEVLSEDGHALCGPCRSLRPGDPLILESLFLPFASQKELLRTYGATDIPTALNHWAEQNQLSPGNAATRLLRDPGATGLFGREAILRMRPNTRSAPFGYTRRDGVLIPEPEEVHTIATFFRMSVNGMSLRQIAEVANQKGIPTSRGGRWQASTIRHILRNPIYVGRVRRNNMVREEGPHGFINPDLFETVQRGLTRRAKRARKSIEEGPFPPPL